MIKCFSLETIEKQIAFWENMKKIYLRTEILPDDDIALCAYKLYFRLGNVKAVTNELIAMGFSIEGKNKATRKLIYNDVSSMIEKNTIDDKELQTAAREMLKDHKKFMANHVL